MGIYARHNSEWYRVDEGGSAGGSAWGDFTTNGDETESGTYGPDAQGRMWKWSQYSTRKPNAETYSIDLSGGMYRILTASGGGWGNYSGGAARNMGGDVNDGLHELSSGTYQIQVGKRIIWGDTSVDQMPLTPTTLVDGNGNGFGSIQTRWSYNDVQQTGSASPLRDDLDNQHYARFNGQHSDITGVVKEYGAIKESDHTNPSGIPMGFGNYAQDGGFIIATVTNDESDWNQPGALPGLGGWATITDVKGKGTKYSYGDWVAIEWSGSGSMTLQADGLLDVLCASTTFGGHPIGGRINRGLVTASGGRHNVKVGLSSGPSWQEKVSEIAGVMTSGVPVRPWDTNELGGPGAWSSGSGVDAWSGISYDITGNPVLYCHYEGTTPGSFGQNGTVIVRVPKANYTGNLPDGAFDVPTARQAIVEALEEKVEEAKEAVRDRRRRR